MTSHRVDVAADGTNNAASLLAHSRPASNDSVDGVPKPLVEDAAARRIAVPYPGAWKAVIALGPCAVVAYFFVRGVTGHDLMYSGIGVTSTVVMLFGIRTRRPSERVGWLLLAAANALFVLGDGVYDVYDLVLHAQAPFPSVADALYLAGYPFLFAGVFRISRLRGGSNQRESRVDAAMVSVGALALFWNFLMRADVSAPMSEFGKLVTMAYPVMDLGVLFIVLSAVMRARARRPADSLVAAAVALMVIADFVYDVLVLHSSYTAGNPIDALFLINYVVLAAAALHPSVADPMREVADASKRRSWLPLVAVAAFVSPMVILASSITGVQVDARVLAATSVVLLTLGVFRISWMVGRLRSQANLLTERSDSLRAALTAQLDLEGDLRHQAFHDSLTGLANRALLHDRVEHALLSSLRRSGTVAVCFCDLDGFKGVNDTLGHHVGDELLVIASKRLTSVVRSGDTVARLGGDEFAILLDNVDDVDAVTALAARVVSVLREPAMIDDQQVLLSVSVGVAFSDAGTTAEDLLSEADAAMYEAKADGKDRFTVFEPVMRSRIVDRMTQINSFHGSLHRAEFFLEYQPQVRLSDGKLQGFEALVRWQHPSLGLLGPYRFIPLAEETGFIVPLGRWVLERACLEAVEWASTGPEPLTVSVNLSVRQLQDQNLLQDVQTALSFSGLPPDRLVLEVTESMLMLDPNHVAEVLRSLKRMGIGIAIDDFGTGYSSLSYLRQFPVDILKIDKSFIDPLDDPSSEALALLETMLRLADDLHLKVTAEGIEHQIQWDALTRMRCHSAQGYLMSRPLSSHAARRYIAERMTATPTRT